MRIRLPFAGAFLFFIALAGYAGLSSIQADAVLNDKALHTLTFFILTVCFYWILDTSRRRNLNYSLVVCTFGLGFGSEIPQGFLPNGRIFDIYDIIANVVGSLAAIAICSWYHQRMLERKRLAKHYQIVPSGEDEHDLELGEGVGAQESGVAAVSGEEGQRTMTMDEELDNWDDNAVDPWDEEEEHATGTDSAEGEGLKTPSATSAGEELEGKKRAD